jgi:GT2 family glycosyltransferase
MKHVVIQHPFWWQMIRHMPPEFEVVFDCMDDIGGFSNTESFLLSLERDLVDKCDKLVVSSDFLYKKHRVEHATNIVRNAGQIEHFIRNDEMPFPSYLIDSGFIKSVDKIKLGYVGAIAEWFDWEMIARVAEENPSFEFHLCGAVTASGPRNLERFSNVKFYGEVPYDSVPAFIAQMDVMIIPFQIIPLIEACDPVKFYEYSAMGKPTIATRMPELYRARELVFFASNPHEFAERTMEAVAKVDEPFRSSLVEYARNNSWKDRGEQFAAVLDDHPKVSVVVLSYGAPAWTLATLYSLTQDGGNYPNLEIIVVDNGSSEESFKEIRSFISSHSLDINLIENRQNLGFAAGNNVGIRSAQGEYVLLLNNDTFVSPGSIASMVYHLRSDRRIGVIGPLTNNIGNEARIEVAYPDMTEMKSVARAVTTGYRGVATEIPVVAYFAAMFRASDFGEFGLLSEDYGRGMFEDDDHCMVIRSKGYICSLAEDAFIHHHLSATFSTMESSDKKALFDSNRAIFESKWGEWVPHKYRTGRPAQSFDEIIL